MFRIETHHESGQGNTLVVWVALWAAILGLAGCDRFPQDPRQSLDAILERETLRVGVLESPPWTMKQPSGTPGGVEAELIEDFARSLGVKVQWRHQDGPEQIFEALKRYELDVVIGRLTQSNPWKKHVAFSVPYYTSEEVVALPVGVPPLSDLAGVRVAVRPESGLREVLTDRGADVTVREELAGFDGAVAGEAWEVERLGFLRTDITLRRHRHVMAVPQGENALLMKLEAFLLNQSDPARLGERLWEASQ